MKRQFPSRAALQQAAVIQCGFTYRYAADLLSCSSRIVWSSVKAYPGSGRKHWDNRTPEEQLAAVQAIHEARRQHVMGVLFHA